MIKDRFKRRSMRFSLIRGVNKELGICEQIRIVYDSVHKIEDVELREELIEKLIDTMIMAKKMGDRLAYYANTYNDKTGHQGLNLEPVDQKELQALRGDRKWQK